MREHLTKAFKWLISVSFFILGVYFWSMTDGGTNIRPVFPALMCFGVVFFMSHITYGDKKDLFFVTVAVVLITAALSGFVFTPMFKVSFYIMWFVLTALFGTPAMVYAFKKYGD